MKVIKKRIPQSCEFEELFNRSSLCQSPATHRNMLDNVHLGCYVETEDHRQYGTVIGITRDKYGVPVCLKVKYELEQVDSTIEGVDYISVERVSFYESYSVYVPDDEYYDKE